MIHVYGDCPGFDIDSSAIEAISFYYNSKTHRYEVHLNYGSEKKTFEVSKAKGETIVEFLRWLGQESKELSPRSSTKELSSEIGSEDSFDWEDFGEIDEYFVDPQELREFLGDLPEDEDSFAEDLSEEIFDSQGEEEGDA
ncbi:hypothetical protein [Thermococcus sp.]|uniref:hypothetical protein n=1 Tax=Thermococcus sp. TaxID=35749 RepID=UPI002620A86F|nr:hypothetical protein [Thermococcus sp.]